MLYQNLAHLYDRLMEHAPYDQWYEFTESIIKRESQEVNSIVDLGCGTGEVTLKLAKAGYNVVGIDYSQEMLAHAAEKAQQEKQSITWLKQDLRSLEGLSNVDLAISYCDVINYIPEKADLQKVFSNVWELLKPGGIFIFDVHDLGYVKTSLQGKTFADVDDDYSYIWFCDQGDYEGEMYHHLTFYSSIGDNKFLRFDELHHQRTFSTEVYEQLLEAAGFQTVKTSCDFSLKKMKDNKSAERIFFWSVKKG